MPKRKRDGGAGLPAILQQHQDEIFRALKTSKGFERQRLSKRLRDQGITPDKTQRLEREISVLKSLDLHQTARAHLHHSLLKVKPLADSPRLPDELRRGVPKPDLPPEEQVALHNVTSGLYNRDLVRQATDRAVKAVCSILDVAIPQNAKRSRKDKRLDQEERPSDGMDKSRVTTEPRNNSSEAKNASRADEESEFEGFSSDDDEPKNTQDEPGGDADQHEETNFEKLNDLLGSSSGEEEDWNDEKYAQFRGKETVNLGGISVSGSDNDESDAELGWQISSRSPSPAVEKKEKTAEKTPSAGKPAQISGSTFLPSLMGGYISGSESASDMEEAKPKKRRGQRARQAIWEKKYGANAKHLQKGASSNKGGRDAGWDTRRGAVDGDDQRRKSPWKKGVPQQQRPGMGRVEAAPAPAPKPRKRDDEGALHPSWEARKRARETQKTVAFSGQKVVFD